MEKDEVKESVPTIPPIDFHKAISLLNADLKVFVDQTKSDEIKRKMKELDEINKDREKEGKEKKETNIMTIDPKSILVFYSVKPLGPKSASAFIASIVPSTEYKVGYQLSTGDKSEHKRLTLISINGNIYIYRFEDNHGRQRNIQVIDLGGEGNCMFYSIAGGISQLDLTNIPEKYTSKHFITSDNYDIEIANELAAKLRVIAVNEMDEKWDGIYQYLIDQGTDKKTYFEGMTKRKWGGVPEIQAIANVFDIMIEVWSGVGGNIDSYYNVGKSVNFWKFDKLVQKIDEHKPRVEGTTQGELEASQEKNQQWKLKLLNALFSEKVINDEIYKGHSGEKEEIEENGKALHKFWLQNHAKNDPLFTEYVKILSEDSTLEKSTEVRTAIDKKQTEIKKTYDKKTIRLYYKGKSHYQLLLLGDQELKLTQKYQKYVNNHDKLDLYKNKYLYYKNDASPESHDKYLKYKAKYLEFKKLNQ